jgi:hypothetical protein
MQRATYFSTRARRALPVLVCAAALTVGACDNDINFTPTAPTFPDITPVNVGRNLEISGRLAAERGGCLEATVLYDGEELPGARTQCLRPGGCATLELTAATHSSPGSHTVAFKVLRQSPDAVSYVSDGWVQVSRVGLGTTASLPLKTTRTTLRPGESVSYEIEFTNLARCATNDGTSRRLRCESVR